LPGTIARYDLRAEGREYASLPETPSPVLSSSNSELITVVDGSPGENGPSIIRISGLRWQEE